ncbi:MAG: LytTR family DNA-binding domain-containing protein, partial [Lachnospiraceae bacterium]|nr:LytTR family DNA-binding domain-containing protein [Lachnospiraceae bacterium]
NIVFLMDKTIFILYLHHNLCYTGYRRIIVRHMDKPGGTRTLRDGICDDEASDREALEKHLQTFQFVHDLELKIESFSSGKVLLESHSRQPYQIILLDVEMPGQNGMEIARCLREQGDEEVFLVFVTSYPQYMRDSFSVQPFQFLTKPIDFSEIEKLFSAILQRYQNSHTTRVLIDVNGEEHLVHINKILYIKAIKDKRPVLEYVFSDTSLIARGTIQKWEETLTDYGFISPCRGYLVNMRHVSSFNTTHLRLTNGLDVPVSRRRAKILKQAYANRIIHLMN